MRIATSAVTLGLMLVGLLTSVFAPASDDPIDCFSLGPEQILRLQSNTSGKVSMPYLTTLNGTVYVVYAYGSGYGGWTKVVCRASFDGVTWGPEIFIHGMLAGSSATHPAPIFTWNGILFVPVYKNWHYDQEYARSDVYLAWSSNGVNWQLTSSPLPQKSSYQIVGQNAITTRNGTLVLGASYCYGAPNATDMFRSFFWYCPSGKDPREPSNWQMSEDIPRIPAGYVDEPVFVELTDDRLLCIYRTVGNLYATITSQEGKVWSQPQKAFQAYNSPAQLLRISYSPNLVLAAWDNSTSERKPLVIALSGDDCSSWGKSLIVQTDMTEQACYPSLALMPNGNVVVGWWQYKPYRSNNTDYQSVRVRMLTPRQPPIANFSFTPSTPKVNQTIVFNASISHDPDGAILNYTWDFGDNKSVTEVNPATSYAYSEAGNYTVTMKVTDNDGLSNTTTASLMVTISLLGDINSDWTVDIYDALLLANAYNIRSGEPKWSATADINHDDIVDIYDAILLANNYGRTA